jgi:hypothetical protein
VSYVPPPANEIEVEVHPTTVEEIEESEEEQLHPPEPDDDE